MGTRSHNVDFHLFIKGPTVYNSVEHQIEPLQPFSLEVMITKISLIALAVTILAPSPANAATCIDLPVCKKSGMADPCQKAVERWEANGIFETNGAATISRFAKSGSLSCSAALSCNSGGGFNRFIGSDIRRL